MTSLDALSSNSCIRESPLDARHQKRAPAARVKISLALDDVDEAAALAALKAREEAEWENPHPRVLVAYVAPGAMVVPLVRPSDTEVHHGLIALEHGQKRCGESRFAYLELMEQRGLDGNVRQQRSLLSPELLQHLSEGSHLDNIEAAMQKTCGANSQTRSHWSEG